jgi:colanic acid/amylovoran biosynthesis glycosyltransferase
MKIAMVVQRYPAPSETFVRDQVHDLVDRGHEVTVIALRAGTADIPGVRVYVAPKSTTRERLAPFVTSPRARRFLDPRHGFSTAKRVLQLTAFRWPEDARGTYDGIHAHFGLNGLWAAWARAAGGFSGPLAVTYHGYDVSREVQVWGERLYRPLFRVAELHLPVSDYFGRRLISMGAPPDRVRTHRYGVDLRRFEPRKSALPLDRGLKVLSVGRFVEKKGFLSAIRAVHGALAAGAPIHYTLVGAGPLHAHLVAETERLGLRDQIKVLDWADPKRIAELMGDAHLLLAPSVTAKDGDEEGIPVVIMEAMARAVPVVSTWHSGIPELVIHEENGWLANEGDVDQLTRYLLRAWKLGDGLHEMGREAHRAVSARHDQAVQADRFERLLAELAKSPQTRP